MSPPLSSHRTLIDKRGFAFVLPRLGLPDPAGEWVILKAAIGHREGVLDRLLHDQSLQLPLRPERGHDSAVVPLRFQGALWVLPLLKPASPSPAAAPEFFRIKARRVFPDALAGSDGVDKLPDECVWAMIPMTAHEDQLAGKSEKNKSKQKLLPTYLIDGGTAAQIKLEPEKAMSEAEVRSGVNIFRDSWCTEIFVEQMRAAAHRGDSNFDPTGLTFRVRVHPAKNDDFASLDYALVRRDDRDRPIEEEEWQPVPMHATKPEGMRHAVNWARKGAGKRAFSKGEWPPSHPQLP